SLGRVTMPTGGWSWSLHWQSSSRSPSSISSAAVCATPWTPGCVRRGSGAIGPACFFIKFRASGIRIVTSLPNLQPAGGRECESAQDFPANYWTFSGTGSMVLIAAIPESPFGNGPHIPDSQHRCRGKEAAMKWVVSLLREEEAATAVEYAVMLALILAGIIASIASVGQGTGGMWSCTYNSLNSVGFGS